ncbi:MAG: single-stranded-DNA-specific exonuclease RecJ [Clostridiaceae bacterium]|nr:single-stranded-DNA-specific exonuclease RecJ [Clostridiaceae bacterium]
MKQATEHWLQSTPWQLLDDGTAKGDLLTRVLSARGFDTAEKRRVILNASSDDLPDPFLLHDMDKACSILLRVLEKEHPKLLIFGDYDADGLTAAAILCRYFDQLGVRPDWLIPDRFDDGYGLSEGLVDEISYHHPDLVVTVDTGTSSGLAVAELKKNGIEVIVTDHHQATGHHDLLDVPIINPTLEGEGHLYQHLSGAGVALLLTLALDQKRGEISPVRDTLMTLASVGTIADVVPLLGANRIIAREGILRFQEDAPEGLKAVCRVSGTNTQKINARDIAFSVAPRLNAAGRMGDVRLAMDLLLANDKKEADRLATELDLLNQKRREVEQDVFSQALLSVTSKAERPGIAIVAGKDWHPGVLGIVSSRMAEKLRVPAITLNEDNGWLTGSARSFGHIDLIKAIRTADHFLEKYGGHTGAAGLTLKADNLKAFEEHMALYFDTLDPEDRVIPHWADIKAEAFMLELQAVENLESMEPTGEGFERLVVWLENFTIESIARVGNGRHLKLTLRSPDESMQSFDALFFGRGDEAAFYDIGDVVDMIAAPEINEWNHRRTVQLRLVDVRPAAETKNDREAASLYDYLTAGNDLLQYPVATRPELSQNLFAALWQLIEMFKDDGRPLLFSPVRLAWLVSHRYNVKADALDMTLALLVFHEVGLLRLLRAPAFGFQLEISDGNGLRPVLSESPLWRTLEALGVLRS